MSKNKRSFPAPLTILMVVIVFAALCTWIMPAGQYDRIAYENHFFILSTPDTSIQLPATQHTLDSLNVRIRLEKFENGDIRKPVSVPGTFHPLGRNAQGFIAILLAPLEGIYETVDIIFLVLFIGGFIGVFYSTGAIEKGMKQLTEKMRGREAYLISVTFFLFALGGSTFGMAEEGMAFYPLLVPVFMAAGYDLLIPLSVIYLGTSVGNISSITNPFATIIASDAAGINWVSGIEGRLALYILSTILTIFYIIRYGSMVKKDPSRSLVLRIDGPVKSTFAELRSEVSDENPSRQTTLILVLFLGTFAAMVFGVIVLKWWLLEMTALFMASTLLLGFLIRMNEKMFIHHFIRGAESLLGVAIIIGVARGITIVLNDGLISDTILYYCAGLVASMPGPVFIVMLFFVYMILTLFISSSSGMAVLTMPIMGSLSAVVGVEGEQIVNAYLYGFGVMSIITPTGLILPALSMVNVSFKTWLKFIMPLLIMLSLLCIIFLVAGVIF